MCDNLFVELYYGQMMNFDLINKRLCASLDAEAEGCPLFSKKNQRNDLIDRKEYFSMILQMWQILSWMEDNVTHFFNSWMKHLEHMKR